MNNAEKITIIVISTMLLLALMGLSMKGLKSSEDTYKKEQKIKMYESYYMATEELLDSIGVYGDNDIFNTKAGRTYLNAKYEVDENSEESD